MYYDVSTNQFPRLERKVFLLLRKAELLFGEQSIDIDSESL